MDISGVSDIKELDAWLASQNLNGHWNHADRPHEEFTPYLWKGEAIRTGLMKASELVPMDQTGRRTVQMRVPTLRGRMSNSIHMSVQCVLPGEVAEAHRHTAAAVRYVVQGVDGAATVVDGEPFPMETGDLITTPGWSFHDHFNNGDRPVIWLDVLDSRVVALGRGLGEGYPSRQQPQVKPANFSLKTRGHVQPTWLKHEGLTPPAMRYPWAETEAALTALREAEVEPDPYDGYHLLYTHPVTGGATLPTFACELHLLPPQLTTQDHRHISTTIYEVFRGAGTTIVDGQRLDWAEGDIFVIPPWSWHHHENLTGADAVLFSVDDWPTLKALDLYREEGKVS